LGTSFYCALLGPAEKRGKKISLYTALLEGGRKRGKSRPSDWKGFAYLAIPVPESSNRGKRREGMRTSKVVLEFWGGGEKERRGKDYGSGMISIMRSSDYNIFPPASNNKSKGGVVQVITRPHSETSNLLSQR